MNQIWIMMTFEVKDLGNFRKRIFNKCMGCGIVVFEFPTTFSPFLAGNLNMTSARSLDKCKGLKPPDKNIWKSNFSKTLLFFKNVDRPTVQLRVGRARIFFAEISVGSSRLYSSCSWKKDCLKIALFCKLASLDATFYLIALIFEQQQHFYDEGHQVFVLDKFAFFKTL